MGTNHKRLVDFLCYVAIAIVVLGIGMACAFYTAHYGKDVNRTFPPVAFFFATLILFGWLINDYRAHLKTGRFWALLSFFFLFHVGMGVLLLPHAYKAELIMALIVLIPEYQLLKWTVGSLVKANRSGGYEETDR